MILTIMKQTTLFIILLAALLLTACSQKEKTYRIAVSQCSVGKWRFKLNDELLAAQYLYDQNVKVEIINCYDRSDVQVRQIDSLSQSDIDLLVVAPNEYEEVAPALRRAKERGVPVILFDRKVDTDDYTAFIGGDNVAVGRMAAEYAMLLVAQSAGKHILEVTALQSTSPSLDRHRGFEEVMRSHPQMDYQCIFSDWNDHHTHDIVKEQLEQGKRTMQPTRLDLGSLITDSIVLMRSIADLKDVTINLKSERMLVTADREALRTILRNIISNAIKFSPKGGVVEVGTKAPSSFYVHNDGEYLPQEKIDEIMHAKTRVESRVGTSGESGTGVGLLLCRELVALNHGTMQILSAPNEGVTMVVNVPR